MTQEDYTTECINYINKIINHGARIRNPVDRKAVEEYSVELLNDIHLDLDKIYVLELKAPKEVYSSFMSKEEIEDPVFAWALWWAKEKNIIKHYGPGGTTAWALMSSGTKLLTPELVCVGGYSPFNLNSMLKYMENIMKYSSLVHLKSIEDQKNAEKSIEKTRSELESEKEYARIQSRVVWS